MGDTYHCECCNFRTTSLKDMRIILKSKTHKIKKDKKGQKGLKEQSIESRIQELTNRLLKSEENI